MEKITDSDQTETDLISAVVSAEPRESWHTGEKAVARSLTRPNFLDKQKQIHLN